MKRRAAAGQKERLLLHGARLPFDEGQHAVIRRKKHLPFAPQGENPPRCADSRIDHHHEDRRPGPVADDPPKEPRRLEDVEGLDLVAQIDDRRVGPGRNHTLDRRDVGILHPEIGNQCDSRLTHCS